MGAIVQIYIWFVGNCSTDNCILNRLSICFWLHWSHNLLKSMPCQDILAVAMQAVKYIFAVFCRAQQIFLDVCASKNRVVLQFYSTIIVVFEYVPLTRFFQSCKAWCCKLKCAWPLCQWVGCGMWRSEWDGSGILIKGGRNMDVQPIRQNNWCGHWNCPHSPWRHTSYHWTSLICRHFRPSELKCHSMLFHSISAV